MKNAPIPQTARNTSAKAMRSGSSRNQRTGSGNVGLRGVFALVVRIQELRDLGLVVALQLQDPIPRGQGDRSVGELRVWLEDDLAVRPRHPAHQRLQPTHI